MPVEPNCGPQTLAASSAMDERRVTSGIDFIASLFSMSVWLSGWGKIESLGRQGSVTGRRPRGDKVGVSTQPCQGSSRSALHPTPPPPNLTALPPHGLKPQISNQYQHGEARRTTLYRNQLLKDNVEALWK